MQEVDFSTCKCPCSTPKTQALTKHHRLRPREGPVPAIISPSRVCCMPGPGSTWASAWFGIRLTSTDDRDWRQGKECAGGSMCEHLRRRSECKGCKAELDMSMPQDLEEHRMSLRFSHMQQGPAGGLQEKRTHVKVQRAARCGRHW